MEMLENLHRCKCDLACPSEAMWLGFWKGRVGELWVNQLHPFFFMAVKMIMKIKKKIGRGQRGMTGTVVTLAHLNLDWSVIGTTCIEAPSPTKSHSRNYSISLNHGLIPTMHTHDHKSHSKIIRTLNFYNSTNITRHPTYNSCNHGRTASNGTTRTLWSSPTRLQRRSPRAIHVRRVRLPHGAAGPRLNLLRS